MPPRLRVSLSVSLLLTLLLTAPVNAADKNNTEGKFLGAAQTELPTWFTQSFLDFSQDIKDAAAAHKRVMLYVYQHGCPYCHRLIEHNFGQKDIAEETRRNFDVIALNMWGDREVTIVNGKTMTEKAFAKAIGVRYTPTLLFFDEQGNVVLRLDGYYPPNDFRIALDYVAGHHEHETSYHDYFAAHHKQPASGHLNHEPYLMPPPYNLAANRAKSSRPLAVLFEQKHCHNCDLLHHKVLADPTTRKLIRQFDVVQLDMWSDTPLTTPTGTATTAKAWARALHVNYAPSIVLFDEHGKEVMRTDAFLKTFHTQSVLAYVLEKAYLTQPEFQRYIQQRADRLREHGVDVNIWK